MRDWTIRSGKALANGPSARPASNLPSSSREPGCAPGPCAQRAREALAALGSLVDRTTAAGSQAATQLYPVAGDFLRAVTLALMAWACARLDAAAHPAASAFWRWVWPEYAMRAQMVDSALSA